MAKKRNPLRAASIPIAFKGPRRRRPRPIPSDDDIRAFLGLWAISYPMPPAWQDAINFRLLDILQKRQRKKPSPLQQAVAGVAILTSGFFDAGWSHYHACSEMARIYGVDRELLERSSYRVRNRNP